MAFQPHHIDQVVGYGFEFLYLVIQGQLSSQEAVCEGKLLIVF